MGYMQAGSSTCRTCRQLLFRGGRDLRPEGRWARAGRRGPEFAVVTVVACVTPMAVSGHTLGRGTHPHPHPRPPSTVSWLRGKGRCKRLLKQRITKCTFPPRPSLATPGWAKTRARTVVPAVRVPCPRALLQDLPQVAPGPDILTALAGSATHSAARGMG